jgi:hypothetical protein
MELKIERPDARLRRLVRLVEQGSTIRDASPRVGYTVRGGYEAMRRARAKGIG